jgi:hypothetical protein
MSKKTNAEKQARRARPRAHKRHPRGRLNPAFTLPADWKGPEMSLRDVASAAIDFALGYMFVDALRKTGIRSKIVDMLFSEPPEDQAAEGAD